MELGELFAKVGLNGGLEGLTIPPCGRLGFTDMLLKFVYKGWGVNFVDLVGVQESIMSVVY